MNHLRQKKLADGALNFLELSREQMIRILDPIDLFGLSQRTIKRFHLGAWPKLVASSLNDELGFQHTTEKVHVRGRNGNAQPHESGHARIARSNTKPNARTERESYETNRDSRKASAKIIQGRLDVFTLADAMAEASGAFPNSPKIEAQRRETSLPGGLRGSENHLVVHRPAVERVRMAHHRSKAWLSLRVPCKQGFERPLEAGDEKMFDFRNSPPLADLLVRSNTEARLVALLPRSHSPLVPEIV
jgi:hypothetical protein